jgi:rhamnose transport system ATP-binding protein
MTDVGISLVNVTKSYGPTPVLNDVTVGFRPGTIHGLVGENGAGKSTLMKVLSGIEQPDNGGVVVDGRQVSFKDPHAALEAGISIISQELAIVPSLTVAQNVFLGHCAHRLGWRVPQVDRQRFKNLCVTAGFNLDPDAQAGRLPLAAQQQVEILRALSRDPRVIIMDEPTAVLTDQETEAVLGLMRTLADSGTTVILISHFLQEVLETCDEVTVLRDGVRVLSDAASAHTSESLVSAMVGHDVDVLYPERPALDPDAAVVLEAHGLTRASVVRDVDISVRRGEIVGLAGLVGSGRTEVARLVFGADRADKGTIRVNGRSSRRWSTRAAMRAGIAMVPESRKDEGLLLRRSVKDNLAIANIGRVSRWGVLRRRAIHQLSRDTIERLDIRAADPAGAVWTLSGGNQQKVLLGRWIARQPDLLIVDEPTRGVDIAAKASIHRLVTDLARQGTAVLLISSEVEEVLGLSHRVLVMRRGEVSAHLEAATSGAKDVLTAAFAELEEAS